MPPPRLLPLLSSIATPADRRPLLCHYTISTTLAPLHRHLLSAWRASTVGPKPTRHRPAACPPNRTEDGPRGCGSPDGRVWGPYHSFNSHHWELRPWVLHCTFSRVSPASRDCNPSASNPSKTSTSFRFRRRLSDHHKGAVTSLPREPSFTCRIQILHKSRASDPLHNLAHPGPALSRPALHSPGPTSLPSPPTSLDTS